MNNIFFFLFTIINQFENVCTKDKQIIEIIVQEDQNKYPIS